MTRLLRKLGIAVAAVGLWAGGHAPAQAGPAYTLDNLTGVSLANPPFTLGFQFAVHQTIVITQIGLFDSGQDGLEASHQFGLWDSNGVLLRSGTIDAGLASPLINQFRYVAIAELVLEAGQQYQLGALYASDADPLVFPGDAVNFATTPEITFLAATFAPGATLENPLSVGDVEPGYFGPNFLIRSSIAPVPEPATLASAGLALLVSAGIARRRARRTPLA